MSIIPHVMTFDPPTNRICPARKQQSSYWYGLLWGECTAEQMVGHRSSHWQRRSPFRRQSTTVDGSCDDAERRHRDGGVGHQPPSALNEEFSVEKRISVSYKRTVWWVWRWVCCL